MSANDIDIIEERKKEKRRRRIIKLIIIITVTNGIRNLKVWEKNIRLPLQITENLLREISR